jgi:hypothetical protein
LKSAPAFFFLVRRHLRQDIFNGKWTHKRRLLKQKVLIIKIGISKLIFTWIEHFKIVFCWISKSVSNIRLLKFKLISYKQFLEIW